ncbi:hypothetical protein L210DRAFT_3521258 [Boletus edulis BED1]|uniref:Uncharacterized protein n=1 Tax=Boletus edulis BED1 TaxID=1328754 RepID=A0AAD4C7P1_BOLED|nr:hypothetical protein L210DRAFT_3521258 [Boletus edulis BED1]
MGPQMYLGTTDRDKPAGGKQVGLRGYVFTKFPLPRSIRTMIPFQVLQDIDNARNSWLSM